MPTGRQRVVDRTCTPDHAHSAGRRVLWVSLAPLAALSVTVFALGVTSLGRLGEIFLGIGRQRDGCAGCVGTLREARIVRGERVVARIRQVARPLPPERTLTLYLAHGSGPALDSARAGLLAAVADVFTGPGVSPVLGLVPRDSTRGLPLVGRIVIGAGQAAIPVYQIELQPPQR